MNIKIVNQIQDMTEDDVLCYIYDAVKTLPNREEKHTFTYADHVKVDVKFNHEENLMTFYVYQKGKK